MHTTRWLAAALLLASATAFAAEEGPGREARQAARAQAFAQADADGNGALSAQEFATFETLMRAQHAQHWFAKADTDGDGQVTAAELQEVRSHKRGCRGGPDA